MGIQLGQQDRERHPALKLRAVGDWADVQIVDVREVPRLEFGTQTQRVGRNGKPQTQYLIEVLVVGGKAVTVDGTSDRAAEAEERAVIFAAGRDKWDPDLSAEYKGRSFSEAIEAVPGGLECGDVLRWRFEDEVPGQGAQPRKVRTFAIRKPGDDNERMRRDLCEQAHESSRQGTPVGAAAGGGDDEDPFLLDAALDATIASPLRRWQV